MSHTINAPLKEPGCVLDGLFGQTANDAELISMAFASGWDGSPGRGGDEAEDALNFLNEHVIDSGLCLEWNEGSLMLTVADSTAD